MTCLTNLQPLERCGHSSALRRWLWISKARPARLPKPDSPAALDARSARDIGLDPELLAPPDPRNSVRFWLGHFPI